jgi:hypothetical protein
MIAAPQKCESRGATRLNAKLSTDKREFTSRSTKTEVQLKKLVSFLALRPHHTYELRMAGISHPAGRILDLEKRGYVIASQRITTVDSDGFTHCNVALYSLQGGEA